MRLVPNYQYSYHKKRKSTKKKLTKFYSRRDYLEIAIANGKTISDTKFQYQLYLKTPHWQKLRRKKLKQVNWKCESCKSSIEYRQLEVHHLTYIRKGKEKLSDLQVLCSNCHKKAHNL